MVQLLSLLVENRSGVLARVVGLFSQRGYNIETLNVAPTSDPTMSLITLSTKTDVPGTEQVIKQLNKLIDVIKVIPYNPQVHMAREMALIRVRVTESSRAEVLEFSKVFRARVVDASPQSCVFEVTGNPEKINGFPPEYAGVRCARCAPYGVPLTQSRQRGKKDEADLPAAGCAGPFVFEAAPPGGTAAFSTSPEP